MKRRAEYLEIECLYMPFILSVVWTNYSIQDEMMILHLDSIRLMKTWPGNIYSLKFTSVSVFVFFFLFWDDVWHVRIKNK